MPAKKRLSTVGNAPDAPSNKKKRTSLAPPDNKSSKVGRPKSPNVFRLSPLHVPLKDREAGELLTLGKNDVGQLGLGEDVDERKKPALVQGMEDVVSVACGGMHTVCLHKSGEVSSFGCNDDGALGRDTSEEGSEFVPGKIELPGRAIQVTAGDSHSAALLEDGKVFAWGNFRDSSGNMGLTGNGGARLPLELSPGIEFVKISSGDDHLAMLAIDGVVYTCGNGEQGQLGRVTERFASRFSRHGPTPLLTPNPVDLKSSKPSAKIKFSEMWTGSYCTFLKDVKSENIYVFGLNNYRQIGLENEVPYFHPMASPGFPEPHWQQIAGGQHHTLGLDSHGVVYSLGRHDYGRLGLGKECDVTAAATRIPTLQNKRCTQVACGNVVSLALSAEGKVYAWGMGTNLQLGGEDEEDIYEPTLMGGRQLEGRRCLQIAAGGQHTALVVTKKEQ